MPPETYYVVGWFYYICQQNLGFDARSIPMDLRNLVVRGDSGDLIGSEARESVESLGGLGMRAFALIAILSLAALVSG